VPPRYDRSAAQVAERHQREREEVRALATGGTVQPNAIAQRRVRAGATTEAIFKQIHELYRLQGRAVIARVPNEVITIPVDRRRNVFKVARHKGPVDFLGRAGSWPIAFDVKGCTRVSWTPAPQEQHQIDFLRAFGQFYQDVPLAFAFFLIYDALLERCYLVDPFVVRVGRKVVLRERHVALWPNVPRNPDPQGPEYDYLTLLRR
jgi:penicillin-binding protein-related factor A (putative recombinase)